MCSVGNDFEHEITNKIPYISKLELNEVKCNKCKELTPIILLRGRDAYCKECFLAGTNHKFKALLGKSKLIRPNDRVLISYEIGHPSTALLHLIRSGLDLTTPKKLRFEPVFVYIEDQYHLSLNERNDAINTIIFEAKNMNFKMHLVSFTDWVLKNEITVNDNALNIQEDDGVKINNLFKKNTKMTNKKEFFSIYKRNLLIDIAKKLNCKFVFTPELSLDIASNLLANISLGKGAQVSVDTGFCDDRDNDVKILRPLRSFDMKEIAFYNILFKLDPVSVRQPQINPYSSVQNLMKKFVTELQDNFPATVTTIVKTGDKLVSDFKNSGQCKLCKGIILEKLGDLSSEESTTFSRLVSNTLPDHNLSRQECYEKIINQFDDVQDANLDYCYSCFKISDCILDDVGVP